ncbi:hypothetical protein ACLKA6_013514 [Drosophila palustris]
MAEVCITSAMNTTPSEALDAILNLPPIKQISVEISTLAAIRLRDINLWNDHQIGHSSIFLNRVDIPSKTDSCMPVEHLNTPFHILIPRREEWVIGTPGETGALSFYTDGSKLNSQHDFIDLLHDMSLFQINHVSNSLNRLLDLVFCTRRRQQQPLGFGRNKGSADLFSSRSIGKCRRAREIFPTVEICPTIAATLTGGHFTHQHRATSAAKQAALMQHHYYITK